LSETAVVFLDRDGTVIVDRGYLSDPAGVELIPGVAEALRRLRAAQLELIFVSNQSGIGRGLMTREQSDAVHHRTVELLAAEGIAILGSYICPHAPWDHCECRKPSTVLLRQAAQEYDIDFHRSFMVGDKKTDADTGHAAGCRTVLYATTETKDNAGATPDFRSSSWTEIADWILGADADGR
jgi:D-glycero-D-manno-heptose 1,7-bisphosphate phosphatase